MLWKRQTPASRAKNQGAKEAMTAVPQACAVDGCGPLKGQTWIWSATKEKFCGKHFFEKVDEYFSDKNKEHRNGVVQL